MEIIDTHTHLYLKEFANDINEVLQRAAIEGVEKLYLPAIDSSETDSMLLLEKNYPGKCFAMMGLHPCSVKENYKEELSLIHNFLLNRKFCAIGEAGLDFYWDTTFTTQQYECFHQQIEWALQYDLPLVIHTRNAMQQTIDVVQQYTHKGLHGIFHCFSGTYKNAVDIINANFLLGIGGVITYKNAGVAEAIKEIDLTNVILETDSPYLTPVPFRGKRNESSYLKYIVKKLGEIKDVSEEEVASVTTANAKRIFGSYHNV